jgi:microcystin-dependent protein
MRVLRRLKGAPAISGEITPPLGAMLDYAGASDPDGGWMLCDGRLLDAVADPTLKPLYDLIGVTYGGSGQSSFAIPDFRGRSSVGPINMGTGPGSTGAGPNVNGRHQGARGAVGGEALHTLKMAEAAQKNNVLTGSENATHTHAPADGLTFMTTHLNIGLNGDAGAATTWLPNSWTSTTGGQSTNHQHNIAGSDATSGHENMPPFLSTPKIIRVR